MKDLIYKLLLSGKLVELFNSLDLSDDVLFEEKLKEPVVVLLLDADLPDVLHVRVDSDPED